MVAKNEGFIAATIGAAGTGNAEGPGRGPSRTFGGQWREDTGEGGQETDAPQQAPILTLSKNLGGDFGKRSMDNLKLVCKKEGGKSLGCRREKIANRLLPNLLTSIDEINSFRLRRLHLDRPELEAMVV